MHTTTTWRKSTRSGSDSNCVEIASSLDRVRDSKNGSELLQVDLTVFMADVKASRFDR
ncbi:MAG TPA: DUF397 domain-containing protein [Pseudonocardiaceae bacterium]